jgi:hypothetical protein
LPRIVVLQGPGTVLSGGEIDLPLVRGTDPGESSRLITEVKRELSLKFLLIGCREGGPVSGFCEFDPQSSVLMEVMVER